VSEDLRRVEETSEPKAESTAAMPEVEVDTAIRQALLRAMTDLYIAKQSHSDSEERQFVELALRLIDLVDADTREAVAAKLLRYRKAPPEIVARLASDIDTVAKPSNNPNAPHQTQQAASPDDPRHAWRSTARELDDLFFSAEPFERRLILFALDAAMIAPAAVSEADAQTVATLERAALVRDTDGFSRILESALAIAPAAARRIAEDDSGEPILVAALALGLSEAVLQRVLLCLNPAIAHSVQRIYDLASLHREVDPRSARRLITIWRSAHPTDEAPTKPATTVHQPPSSRGRPDERVAADRETRTQQAQAAEARPAPLARPTIRWEDYAAKRTADG